MRCPRCGKELAGGMCECSKSYFSNNSNFKGVNTTNNFNGKINGFEGDKYNSTPGTYGTNFGVEESSKNVLENYREKNNKKNKLPIIIIVIILIIIGLILVVGSLK